jgi:hypothetical protein
MKTNLLVITLFTFVGMSGAIGASFDMIQGQSDTTNDEYSKINIQVTNNDRNNEVGSVHIITDKTGVGKSSNDISFHPGQTIIQLFDFGANEMPHGNGFNVEVIYGDDESKN